MNQLNPLPCNNETQRYVLERYHEHTPLFDRFMKIKNDVIANHVGYDYLAYCHKLKEEGGASPGFGYWFDYIYDRESRDTALAAMNLPPKEQR